MQGAKLGCISHEVAHLKAITGGKSGGQGSDKHAIKNFDRRSGDRGALCASCKLCSTLSACKTAAALAQASGSHPGAMLLAATAQTAMP